MNTHQLTVMLQLAGLLHIGLICAGALMPRAVKLRTHLANLPVFIRRLFWVYYTFIGLCLVSFGLITITFAGTLAQGGNLARAICAFLAAFWTVRLVAEQAVKRRLVPRVGRETIRVLPLSHDLKPWRGKNVVRAGTQ